MLVDIVAFFVIILIVWDIAKKFLEQFAPDGLFYQPKHRRQPNKVVSFLIGGDDQ